MTPEWLTSDEVYLHFGQRIRKCCAMARDQGFQIRRQRGAGPARLMLYRAADINNALTDARVVLLYVRVCAMHPIARERELAERTALLRLHHPHAELLVDYGCYYDTRLPGLANMMSRVRDGQVKCVAATSCDQVLFTCCSAMTAPETSFFSSFHTVLEIYPYEPEPKYTVSEYAIIMNGIIADMARHNFFLEQDTATDNDSVAHGGT